VDSIDPRTIGLDRLVGAHARRSLASITIAWMLTPGVTAPEFDSVVDHDGNPVRLADLRGRWVLLWWYPMADTPG
jgi:Peroxiredoxin